MFGKVIYQEENELLNKLGQIGSEFRSPVTAVVKSMGNHEMKYRQK